MSQNYLEIIFLTKTYWLELKINVASVVIYNKTFIYMFPIAGQTAGPIGLNFFVYTQGWPGGVIG